MRRPSAVLAGALAALAVAPAAAAQGPVVQAVDGTPANSFQNRWSPATVTISAGQTVTWSFTGTTVFHNVASGGTNWSFRSGDPAIAPAPASWTFSAPGVYRFVCEIHATTMVGDVIVTDAGGNPPPPPPPPPPSEQPFPNDAGAPSGLEVADALAPRLARLRAWGQRRAARVRFRLDEPAIVTLRIARARVTVERRRLLALAGTRTLTVRGLRPGRYRVTAVAGDLAGNRSTVERARVTVRRR